MTSWEKYAAEMFPGESAKDIEWYRQCDQILMDTQNAIDVNNPKPNFLNHVFIPRILAARKIQAFVRGIVTRNRIHCALLSSDPDVFVNAVLLCSTKKRKRAD